MRYLAFEEARTYVRNQKLENTRAWKKWSKGILEGKERRPDFIPASPDIVYKNSGWLSWSDWISENIEIERGVFQTQEYKYHIIKFKEKYFEERKRLYYELAGILPITDEFIAQSDYLQDYDCGGNAKQKIEIMKT